MDDSNMPDWLDRTLLENFRSTLPVNELTVAEVTTYGAKIAGRSATGRWQLDIDCDLVVHVDQGPELRNRYDLLSQHLAGRSIVEIRAPGDAFDPVLVCDNGTTLALLSGDENNPWYLSCGSTHVEGVPAVDHEDWLTGNLTFSDED